MPKAISMPKLHSVQTVHLSFAETNYLQTEQNKLPLDIHYLGVGVPKVISTHEVHSVQTVHLSCDEINTISK